MKRLIAIAAALAVLALAAALLTGCAATDNAAAARARAEADAQWERAQRVKAEADSYATKKEAQTEAKKAEAAISIERAQAFADRVTAMMPMILTVGLIIVALLVFALMWHGYNVRMACQPQTPAAMAPLDRQLPQPIIHLHLPPPQPGQTKGEYWRGACDAANKALVVVEQQGVTVYEPNDSRLSERRVLRNMPATRTLDG